MVITSRTRNAVYSRGTVGSNPTVSAKQAPWMLKFHGVLVSDRFLYKNNPIMGDTELVEILANIAVYQLIALRRCVFDYIIV